MLDVDGNGDLDPLTDGLWILRHLFGFTGVTGAVGPQCERCDATEIDPYLDSIASQLDADGNLVLGPLTDGVLILRYLFGVTGPSLTTGAVGNNCSRCTPEQIIDYLDTLAN